MAGIKKVRLAIMFAIFFVVMGVLDTFFVLASTLIHKNLFSFRNKPAASGVAVTSAINAIETIIEMNFFAGS